MVHSEAAEKATATKKVQTLETKGGAARRLVEYFVVVSSVPRSPGDKEKQGDGQDWKLASSFDQEDALASKAQRECKDKLKDIDFQPQITARYPLLDYSDNPLHENVTFFCHPSGAIRLRAEQDMPKIHYFVATGGHGGQVYGTCLTLWEPYIIDPDGKVVPEAGDERKDDETALLYLPKCLVILSTYPYLMAFREFLTQLNRLSKMGEMVLPLERYIANFCAEIPAPPPGSFEVQTTLLDSVIKIWSPPHNLPIPWVSLPFSHLFECLDLDNIVLVWHCLVLERQVLLTSTQLSILTTCSEILLSLLFPMRWSHAYIPLLPHFMIPILSAPMPFLCGINKANLADALCDLSRDCVLVDLDKNLVTMGPETPPLPPLPPMQHATLLHELDENVGMVFREARSLTKQDDYSDSGAHLPSHKKIMAEAMWDSKLCLFDEAFHLMFTPEESRKNHLNGNDSSGLDLSDRDIHDPARILNAKDTQRKQSCWDAVQEAFLESFVYLLRNYRKFLVFPSKHNEGSYGGAGFRSKEFIESQRFDMREFLNQLIHTQMFDNFITKRLYGSGEADVAFFDLAVDRFLKNAGLLSNVDLGGRLLHASGVSTKPATEKRLTGSSKPRAQSRIARFSGRSNNEPLLQSARVHRKLKTIVPPEPSGQGLTQLGNGNVTPPLKSGDVADDVSVSSTSTSGTRNSQSGPSSPRRKTFKSVQDKAAEILEKRDMRYTYKIFPSELKADLFGTPRPLSSAVIAEFDRQKKDAAQFRRKKTHRVSADKKKHIQRAHTMVDPEVPESPEVATFTVFFMAFAAMVGKELLEISLDDISDRMILSTYVPTTDTLTEQETMSDSGSEANSSTVATSTIASGDNLGDEAEKEGVADMKTTRPDMGGMFGEDGDENDGGGDKQEDETETTGLDDFQDAVEDLGESERKEGPKDAEKESSTETKTPVAAEAKAPTENGHAEPSKPKSRFTKALSALQIEEAKATGRAQLGLAFEMLTMMKKRALKADPDAYQSLIDACGRVGDTKRATELLAKMHEDGIVADGTVYACLVSAFSAETAWRQADEKEEELPEWANSASVEMDWNKLQKRTLLDRLRGKTEEEEDEEEDGGEESTYRRIRNMMFRRTQDAKRLAAIQSKVEESRQEFFVTEGVERQIQLGENLLEIVYPDISVDTDNETCPRCNFLLSDDDVVGGWTPGDSNDYTTSCPNCTQRFVPHFCVQSTSSTFNGSRGPASPLMCERLSPWVLQKEIRSVMSDREGIENLLSMDWREQEYKNAVLWWNLVLSCMRYRLPFSFLLQGSFEQNLIAPMPEDET